MASVTLRWKHDMRVVVSYDFAASSYRQEHVGIRKACEVAQSSMCDSVFNHCQKTPMSTGWPQRNSPV